MTIDFDLIAKRLDVKDDQVFKLGDVFDVKASIGLIVITFLATQTATFLATTGGRVEHGLEVAAAVALALAGALAFLELWPRYYAIETTEALDGWIGELQAYYQHDLDADAKVAAQLRAGLIKRVKERITVNAALNARKATYLTWSFTFTGIALGLNLITLLLRAA